MDKLTNTIAQYADAGINVLDFNFNNEDVYIPDLSEHNPELEHVNMDDPDEFGAWLSGKIKQNGKTIAAGGYGEDRVVYKRSKHFGQGPNARSIHLGIDLWAHAGTGVLAPFNALIHSFQNNDNHGDYGGTIILTHELNGITFHTLYGHLSLGSLSNKSEGIKISKGTKFAELGVPSENGGWPPHLHFQLIRDMGDKKGDYYGVASPEERQKRLYMCPNPNLILKIKNL